MAQLPRVSIVTPSYNQGRFIRRTITSVLSQEYPNLEYLIIDGGSTDDTLQILRSFGNRIRWVSERDRGQTDAINKGFMMASGDILAWLNSDDTYVPGAVQTSADVFARSPHLAMTYGLCWLIDEHDVPIRPYDLRPRSSARIFDRLLNSDPSFVPQPTVFLSRGVVQEVGPLNESMFMCMDYEYWLRVSQSHQVVFIPKFLANFRLHGSAKSAQHPWRSFQELRRIRLRYSPASLSAFYPRQFYRLFKSFFFRAA